jgi:hypothetical protein
MNTDDRLPLNRRQRLWGRIWAIWLLLAAVSFAVLEIIGLVNRRPGDTLSENTRRWLGTDRTWRTWGALGFVAALVGFVVWFVPHIVFSVW